MKLQMGDLVLRNPFCIYLLSEVKGLNTFTFIQAKAAALYKQ